MKIDRRGFLSFAIGGAAGTALSPLPWKLMDDASIWSQNWAWTPVPADGAVTYENSTCTLCPGGCGITVRKVEGRAVKIEGTKGHPVNDGGICILGLSGLQLLYGPTRVASPLKRIGERGDGKWQKITWDQAISEVSAKLAEVRAAGNSHALGAITGPDRGTVSGLLERFLLVYGSANFVRTPTMMDNFEHVLYLTQGVEATAGFDIENADLVLSFGSGIIEGWGSPVRMFKANARLVENGADVFQIESRLSNTAAKSKHWVPINPGTEADLALGLAHIIIGKGLFDYNFVSTHAHGFEAFKQLVQTRYTPAVVSEKTGVAPGKIEEMAVKFARAAKPLAICGRGKGSAPGGLKEFLAVHMLNALAGSVNRQGGVLQMPPPDYIRWTEPVTDELAAEGLRKGRLDGAGSDQFPSSRHLLNRFIAAAAEDATAAPQVLLVAGANPYYTFPGTQVVKKAFDNIPYIVSFSSYMDETAMNADIILPNHVNLERYEDVPVIAGLSKPVVGLSKPVVAPQLNTRHIGDTIIRIAKAMGGHIAGAFEWDDYQACLEETLSDKWDALSGSCIWVDDAYAPPAPDQAFNTYSSKFEFNAGQTQKALNADNPLPEGNTAEYTLTLIPFDAMRLANGYIGNPPFMTKIVADTVMKRKDGFIEINPVTAGKLGVKQGQRVTLSTPVGEAKVRVNIFEGIKPDIVAIPRGLGHTAYDEYLAGKGVNVNELLGTVEDPASGHDAAWGIRAKLTTA
ncbi:MAG: molybdopterin-dependent oxidoreductase [Desulfobacteraceae bacterium]|nr:molybdopterin-dependent oxidoreductase [Desulfobacteraceae bacterium]